MSKYVKKTEHFGLLGPAAQVAAIDLHERGVTPVVLDGDVLHTVLHKSKSVKVSWTRAGITHKLDFGHEFQGIRKALDQAPIKTDIVCLESHQDADKEEVHIVGYEIRWPFRLFTRL